MGKKPRNDKLKRRAFCKPLMRDWALQLFKCVRCDGSSLQTDTRRVHCALCNADYEIRNEIGDFFVSNSEVPAREKQAVEKLSEIPEAVAELRHLLRKWDEKGLEQPDLQRFQCLQHAADSRAQLVGLLAKHPLRKGSIVLEIGADHCWSSNLLLDHGCRVIASDITNHLELASRAADPALCRIYADMNSLPLRDETVDVVWATSAAHHSWNLDLTFREAERVLKKGGALYFCCEPIPSVLRFYFGKDFGHAERDAGINEMWIKRSDWLNACKKAGMRPQLVYPDIDRASVEERLRKRNIPAVLAPLIEPILRHLQVSIHLIARK